MRTIPILAVIALAAATCAQADVLVYQTVETTRTLGYDRDRTATASGYMVIDWDSGEIRILRARTINGSKQFTISNPKGVRIYVAQGPGDTTYTVMTRYEEKSAPFTEVLDVMWGTDKILAIRPDRLVYSPKTFKGSPRFVVVGDNDDDVELTQSTTTNTYLGKETQSANAANQTVDNVMERYRALYLSKGFYEVPDTQ